jgi:hypothetical protein
MVSQEAESLALRLLASYPAVPVSRMAVLAIAEALDRMGLDIAEPVVERARAEIVKIPSVAQLYDVADEIRSEAREERPALLPGQFIEAMPDHVREKWNALQAKWKTEAEEPYT